MTSIDARAYLEKSVDNVEDLPADLTWTNAEVLEMLREAVDLFEKAHTPTDNEREDAHAKHCGCTLPRCEFIEGWELAWDSAYRSVLRRSEAPEPSVEDEFAPGECTGAGDCDAPIHVHGCYRPHRADQCDAPDEYGHIETQGEPSDAQVHADHAFVQTGAVLTFECSCGTGRSEVVTDTYPHQIDAIAVAIAQAADADYWTDEIAAWEGAEAWEREAHPDNYPGMAYEDRETFRKQARAAVHAIAPQEGIST